MSKRRQFLKQISLLGVAPYIPNLPFSKPPQLKMLVLGGTNFLGPAIVEQANQFGYNVTLFNRGVTNPEMFPENRLIVGDREEGKSAYSELIKEQWDVIIDVWPEKSLLVQEATAELQNSCKQYLFISSIAVYNDFQEVGLKEDSDVVSLELERSSWTYSEEKLAAEQAVLKTFPGQSTVLRPGPITGWRANALDLYYWCLKLKRGDQIIAPGSGMDPLQFIDVKDVANFAVQCVQQNLTGVYNVVGPMQKQLYWKDFLETASKHFKSESKLHWASEEYLRANKVYSFSDLPLWAPLSEDRGFMQISNEKLVSTGFKFRTVEETLTDTVEWHSRQGNQNIQFGDQTDGIGLERSRELALIKGMQ